MTSRRQRLKIHDKILLPLKFTWSCNCIKNGPFQYFYTLMLHSKKRGLCSQLITIARTGKLGQKARVYRYCKIINSRPGLHNTHSQLKSQAMLLIIHKMTIKRVWLHNENLIAQYDFTIPNSSESIERKTGYGRIVRFLCILSTVCKSILKASLDLSPGYMALFSQTEERLITYIKRSQYLVILLQCFFHRRHAHNNAYGAGQYRINISFSIVKKKVKLSCNRPWRPIGLWDVKDPTLSRQSAHS
jgi:hypothetical protein